MRNRNAALSRGDLDTLAWDKMGDSIPAIVQDEAGTVRMLGYVSRASLAATFDDGYVTFFSRSKQRLWRKGETSGNRLRFVAAYADCDDDALLIVAAPEGPTCHLGSESCFASAGSGQAGWLNRLSAIVADRAQSGDPDSYTRQLLASGTKRIAQKVGEEGVELALAAAVGDTAECIEESADLLFHLAVLMQAKGFGWDDVVAALQARHRPTSAPT